MPSIPNPLYRGTVAQVVARAKERAEAMTLRHPGVKFSICTPNPLGVKEGKRIGLPGAGYPQAIIDQKATPISDRDTVNMVINIYAELSKLTRTPYQGTTNIVYADPVRMDFQTLFGVLAYLRREYPYQVRYSVNRLGHGVYVRIDYRELRKILAGKE